MPPIFPPRSNTFARISILVVLILLAAITAGLVLWLHSPTFNKVGVDVPQPLQTGSFKFHSWHVTVVKLDCRYCHESVDKSSFAGIPPTETCMSCHSIIKTNSPILAPIRESWASGKPVPWNRVNKVPDYVYFDHHIHVNKGIGCETCHGRVDQMGMDVKANTFYMAWCLECHRNPAKYIRPKDQVYTMGYQPAEDQATLGAKLVKEYNVMPPSQLMNCSICHR